MKACGVMAVVMASLWGMTCVAQPSPALVSLTPTSSGAATAGSPGLDRPSASELRIGVLYSGHEFSTFQHPPANPALLDETSERSGPFDEQTEDPWFAFDKVKHVTFSFLWTLGTQYVVVNKGRISEHHALPISVSSSALIGVTKEYYDLRSGPPHVFSYRDLVADGVGILLATGVILL